MKREDKIRKLANAVQLDIISCPNEQTYDEGEVYWIHSSSTDLSDLSMNHDIPEDLQEEVVRRLRCPSCDSPLELWQEVGTKHEFELAHDFTIEKALLTHTESLYEFQDFLIKFPMQGGTHVVGKKIMREIRDSPRMILDKTSWFRATATKEYGFDPAPAEFVPEQRYNSSGQPQWYFTDNKEAAVAEVTASDQAWVQAFALGTLDRLLDLRSWGAEDERAFDADGNYRSPHGLLVVSLIFGDFLVQKMEDGSPQKRQWKPEYLIPRFAAEAAKKAGFSGILCSSVRYPGNNLIVFDPAWKPLYVGTPELVKLNETALRLREKSFWHRGHAILMPDYTNDDLI